MGWNDSRATLIAPAWTIVGQDAATGAKGADGAPLRILDTERLEDFCGPKLDPNRVRAWLEEFGFAVTQRSVYGDRLQWEDVEACLGVKEGELAEIGLSFTLTRDSPSRWHVWKSIVEQMCEAWDLRLYDDDLGFPVHASEILHVLGKTLAWTEFEANFNWPTIT